MTTARDQFAAAVEAAGLTVASTFVPYSKSRNAGEWESLNWRVTLQRTGRDVLTADYSAGTAHCPAYKRPVLHPSGNRDDYATKVRIRQEIETGRADLGKFSKPGAAILPDTLDVIASLVRDADVIDAGGFESWAAELGYDTDSRKAERIYRECLEHALALRAGIGADTLDRLRELANEL